MPKDEIYALSIFYNSGNVQKFAFRQKDEDVNLTKHISEFLNTANITIMLENKMIVIPVTSIEHVELSPAPDAWPKNTIYDAKLIK